MLRVFVPGRLVNVSNRRWCWQRAHKYAAQWRALTTWLVGQELSRNGGVRPETPKTITLHAQVWTLFDGDGLQRACKPVRDALQPNKLVRGKRGLVVLQGCGLVETDGPSGKHVWSYVQTVNRRQMGVWVEARW